MPYLFQSGHYHPSFCDQFKEHNDYNRRIFELIQQDAMQGEAVLLSLTDCYRETDYGEPIVALTLSNGRSVIPPASLQ